jgi:hypothetical protein
MAALLISRVAVSANVSIAFTRNRDVGAFISLDFAPFWWGLNVHAMGVESIVLYVGHLIIPNRTGRDQPRRINIMREEKRRTSWLMAREINTAVDRRSHLRDWLRLMCT